MNKGKVLENKIYEFFTKRFSNLNEWLNKNPAVLLNGSNLFY